MLLSSPLITLLRFLGPVPSAKTDQSALVAQLKSVLWTTTTTTSDSNSYDSKCASDNNARLNEKVNQFY